MTFLTDKEIGPPSSDDVLVMVLLGRIQSIGEGQLRRSSILTLIPQVLVPCERG
jgi:hypothetical protein